MMLVEQSSVSAAALPLDALKDHLRLGTGFADAALQDGVLETCLRAAMAAIEGRTGKVLISRSFNWSLSAWRDLGRQVLPVAPVTAITGFSIVDRAGAATVIAAENYALKADTHRPALVAAGLVLPAIPVGGSAEIVFDAGFGADLAALPGDLGQGWLLLAAHFYETRHAVEAAGGIPASVGALIERHRIVRLFGGRV